MKNMNKKGNKEKKECNENDKDKGLMNNNEDEE